MLPILWNEITKTNIGLKVQNYLPLTLTNLPPQALFTRRLMLRVILLDDKHLALFMNNLGELPFPNRFLAHNLGKLTPEAH